MSPENSVEATHSESADKIISKDYVLLTVASFFIALMNFFFLAVLPIYILFLGGSAFLAGMFITVYSLAALIVRPISGLLSDKYGRTKLLVFGAALSAIMTFLYGFIGIFPLLLVVRALHGIGFGMHSTCAGASVADVLPKSRLAEGIGYFALYATVGQAIGPGIALAIVEGGTLGDYRLLFILTAAMCVAASVANALVTYERKRKKAIKAAVEAQTAASEPNVAVDGEAIAKPDAITVIPDENDIVSKEKLPKTILGFEYAVFAPMAVIILLYFGIVSLLSFITTYASWMGFGNSGLFFTVSAAGVFLSRILVGKAADKKSADVFIIPGMAVMVVCIALIPSMQTLSALVILALPLGLAQGVVVPTFNAMLFKRCSPERRGTASGAFFTALDVGFAVGAPLLGAISDLWDFRHIYWAAAIFVALALLVYILICTEKRFNEKQKAKGY